MELSEVQKLAVQTLGKNVCVSAGAGSGKTRVLVERFLHLVMHQHLSPTAILAITFTDKAANEMKRRIVERLREENLDEARREVENAAIGTIHSFAARLLREHPIEAGVDPHFAILESAEAELLQERILDETIEALAGDSQVFSLLHLYGEESVREGILQVYADSRNTQMPFEELLRRRSLVEPEELESKIKGAVDKIIPPPEIGAFSLEDPVSLKRLHSSLRAAGKQKEAIRQLKGDLENLIRLRLEEKSLPVRDIFIRAACHFEKAYQAAKQAGRALDFDDLQHDAVRLLGSETAASKTLRKIYQEKFKEIMVDEFQDTNPLQNRLVELIRRESNLFIVGDLKQSIYGFRGTRVEIFLEKEKIFAQKEDGLRISLAENYRARPKLIHFINSFFETLWKEDRIPFELLQPIREEKGSGVRVERLALEEKGDETAEDLRIREAHSLAWHIRRLVVEEGFHYRDIACLFKATSDVHLYEHAFRRAGIPYFVISSSGFYSQLEIRDVISFLSLLENPRRDIPLAASLRSPLFQISDDTLFWLAHYAKREKKESPLAQGVFAFQSIPEISDSEKRKLEFFVRTFEHFLQHKEKLRISELIEEVLRITDYSLYVLKSRQGERRYANLRKLIEIARELESKETIHLGEFIRTVKGLETREIRQSQAQIEAEDADVVKLLTIHMAKGLEFPVVILADLGRGKNLERENFSLSEEEGLGIRVLNETSLKFEETLTYHRNKQCRERMRSEESKRLLYVAMTRAQERLILAGPKKTADSKKDSFHSLSTWSEWVERILEAGDWEVDPIEEIPAAPFPFERRKSLAERKPIRLRIENLKPIPLRQIPEGIDTILENLVPVQEKSFPRIDLPVSAYALFAKDPEAYFKIYEIGAPDGFSFEEPLELNGEEIGEEELTSADFGTLVHQILEQVVTQKLTEKKISVLTSRFTQSLSEKLRKEILEMVLRFIQTPEAKAIQRAKARYAELPFALRLPFGLVQGKMDLVYQDLQGNWAILDYKTSLVDEASYKAKGEEYRIQLALYAVALWKILKVPPREACIHFLRPSLAYTFSFKPDPFETLFHQFARMQQDILRFREERLLTLPRGRS